MVLTKGFRFLVQSTAVQNRTDLYRGLLKTGGLEVLQRAIRIEVSSLNDRCLSKSYQSQGKLLGNGDQRRRTHGIIEPPGQVAVGEQVEAQ